MPFTLSRPSGRRADDVRALRMRYRRITLSGNFTQATGEVVLASQVGMKTLIGAIALGGLAPQGDQSTGNEFSIIPSANGDRVTIKFYENAAAGSPSGLKTDAEAYTAGQFLDLIFVGA